MSPLLEDDGSEQSQEEEDPIANLEFQKEQLSLRTKATKQSTNEKHKHKPPKIQDKKEKITDEEKRVLDILNGNPVLSKVSAKKFQISSLASDNQYEVTIDKKCDCSCLAKKKWNRNKNCKHILAVAVLLGIRKEGLQQFINAEERKSMIKQTSKFNGNTDENRALFLKTFMEKRTSGETKTGRQKTDGSLNRDLPSSSGTKQNPTKEKPKQPSTKFLDVSVDSYHKAKDILIQKKEQYRWRVDVNMDSRRLCPNHDPGDPCEEKKVAVGKINLVAEYWHIIKTKQKANFSIHKETKYFHVNCVASLTARCLHEDYVNLRPPESIEVDKDFSTEDLTNIIMRLNSLYPQVTILDINGKEIRVKKDGTLSRRDPQPGLKELRQRMDEDGNFSLEDSASEYAPSNSNSDTSVSSPVKKKPRK